MLNVEDLLFLTVDQPSVIFHTNDRQFFLKSILEEWKIILEGFGFEDVDRGVLACMKKVRVIHIDFRRIYFDKDMKGKFCTISASKLKFFLETYPGILYLSGGQLLTAENTEVI